jgi:hypothetical protein
MSDARFLAAETTASTKSQDKGPSTKENMKKLEVNRRPDPPTIEKETEVLMNRS